VICIRALQPDGVVPATESGLVKDRAIANRVSEAIREVFNRTAGKYLLVILAVIRKLAIHQATRASQRRPASPGVAMHCVMNLIPGNVGRKSLLLQASMSKPQMV
jgi:hypothetical protein